MSSISSTGAAAALPVSTFHGHGGGHRRGSPVQASSSTDALTNADSASDSSTPATNQSIFSSLLQTVEQVAGVQLTAPTAAAATAAAATPVASSATTQTTVGASSNDSSAQTLAKLQLLLSNLSQAGAAQSLAGGRINTTA